ncbi:MAG: hypothetical protein PHS60_12870 [Zavarzinia sp.]|nr:hypothetical protein [Zavarzinia sp.]
MRLVTSVLLASSLLAGLAASVQAADVRTADTRTNDIRTTDTTGDMPEGRATGTIGTLKLRHATAASHDSSTDPTSPINYIRVVLDDEPIAPWTAATYSSLSALQVDAVNARNPVVMIEIDVENTEEVYFSASYLGHDDRMYTTENTIPLESLAIGDTMISGSFFGDDDLVTFEAPINKFPVTRTAMGAAARDTAPYKAYLGFIEALARGDLPAARDFLAPDAMVILQRMAAGPADQAKKAGSGLLDRLKQLQPTVYFHGTRAVVVHRDPASDGDIVESLTLSLVQAGDKWKIEDR